jgi:hypothetical protein
VVVVMEVDEVETVGEEEGVDVARSDKVYLQNNSSDEQITQKNPWRQLK